MNHTFLVGRLTKDPELRMTKENTPVVSFTLAVNRNHSTEAVDFIDCVAWRNTAEFVSKYLSKGRQIAVHGELQIRDWTAKDGSKRRNAEVVVDQVKFADSKTETKSDYPVIDDNEELPF